MLKMEDIEVDPILVIILIVIIIILIVYFSGAYKKAMIEIPEYIPYLYVVHNNKIDEDERK